MRARSVDWLVGHGDRGGDVDTGAVEQPLPDRPAEELIQAALAGIGLHRSAVAGDLGEQLRHPPPPGRLSKLESMQRRRVLHQVAIEVDEASLTHLDLSANEVGLERQREGLVRPFARFGARGGGVLGELGAGVQLLGLRARLGVRHCRDGADGNAGLTLAVTIAEEVSGAVRAQAYAEAGDGVVPNGVLGLTGREFEFGDGVAGELHGEQKSSGSVGSIWGAIAFVFNPSYTPLQVMVCAKLQAPTVLFTLVRPHGISCRRSCSCSWWRAATCCCSSPGTNAGSSCRHSRRCRYSERSCSRRSWRY